MDKLKLRIRLGEKEFEAEGCPNDVLARWEEARPWLLVDQGPQQERAGSSGGPTVERIGHPVFDVDKIRHVLRLRVLPSGGRLTQRVAKALLLLIHGYQSFFEKSQIPVTRLADDLRLSGYADLRRLSRAFDQLEADGLAIRSGKGKGTCYQATHPGHQSARDALQAMGSAGK